VQRYLGLALLVVVIIGVTVFAVTKRDAPAPTVETTAVVGAIGGEKSGLLADPQVVDLLASRYHLRVDPRVQGSLDMVQQPSGGLDFLWPSSEVALALYEEKHGHADARNIFNSPIVIYSWTEVSSALTAKGLITDHDGIHELDTIKLAKLLTDGTTPTWQDLGLHDINGTVDVETTNPSRSNSGNMFAGLLATSVNGGKVPTDADLDTVGAKVVSYYGSLGQLESSSGDLFSSFLQLGVGSHQLIAGYENQLIEFGTLQPQFKDTLTHDVQVLYPVPTVYSSHPIIPLTDKGRQLVAAFDDPDLLKLAWTRHGFRSGQLASATNPADLAFGVVPAEVRSVVAMPRPSFMITLANRIG
jgi:hypothetical protein